jgi:AraC-like DNA-binding protein
MPSQTGAFTSIRWSSGARQSAGDADDPTVRSSPHSPEALQLLLDYVALLERDHALAAPELRQLALNHICDLAALAIGATHCAEAIAGSGGLGATRLRTIKAEIIKNLHCGTLTITATAKRHGVTPRYVQRLFEGEGTTFSQFVRDRRLARARQMLADPNCADQAISSIAFAVGFGDLSYFNRVFRRRYGVTPSDMRGRRLDQRGPMRVMRPLQP